MQQISASVYAETDFAGCNTGFIVTTEGVVMVDTPQMPADAIKWRKTIGQYGPVRYLINTEPHGDHFTGNCFFEGTVVAHEGTREAIMAASAESLKKQLEKISPESLPLLKDFYYRPPTITLSQRLTLYLGKHSFQLINLPGHTAYEVAVYIPEEGVIFTSDNVFGKVFPGLQQALPYEWLDSLEKIREIGAKIVVPGHGCVCDGSYIAEMRDFIQDWIDAVTDAINRGLSLEEAQATIDFSERYPAEPGLPFTVQDSQRRNIERLYEVLKE